MYSVDGPRRPAGIGVYEDVRLEGDLLGERELPLAAYHGIHTLRAAENFPLSGRPPRPELLTALVQVKRACVRANVETGGLPETVGQAIMAACDEMLGGALMEHVLVDALQGGAGTSTNMNINEVLANRAEEILGGRRGGYVLVHPIHHVNLNQSTNDVYPTALRLAAITRLRPLERAVAALQAAFQDKEREFADVVKVGRTELQDACPITLGASFSAFAEALSRDRWRVFKCEERLRVVNLGGTAVGTGLTAPRSYIFRAVEALREDTGLGLARAENLVDATQNVDALVEVSGILRAHAVNLMKISSDLRLLASGPKAGLGELILPSVQAGSSVMPGKVNPVICEAAGQAAMRVMGLDHMISLAGQAGQLELNAFLPLLADALLESLALLTATDEMFREKCVQGIQADRAVCEERLHASYCVATALVPVLGYEAASLVAREAMASGRSVPEVALEKGLLDREALREILSPEAMTALGHKG